MLKYFNLIVCYTEQNRYYAADRLISPYECIKRLEVCQNDHKTSYRYIFTKESIQRSYTPDLRKMLQRSAHK